VRWSRAVEGVKGRYISDVETVVEAINNLNEFDKRQQSECLHSPTHDPQSSIICLCSRWASVSCCRHGGDSRGSYNIKAATLGGILGSTTERSVSLALPSRDAFLSRKRNICTSLLSYGIGAPGR